MTRKSFIRIPFPKLRCIEQNIEAPQIENLENHIRKLLEEFKLNTYIKEGDKVAITASSRGIKNQGMILKELVKYIKKENAHPFIVPAMGSHGGGTIEGQLGILREYGIISKKMGCPIKASTEVTEIGKSEFGTPIYINKSILDADKIIIFNKIKSHSKFSGEVESGLSKMCLIGLGNRKGAKLYHRLIERNSWSKVINSNREQILNSLPIICGIAIIQNADNEIAELHVIHPHEFRTKEPSLLKRYKEIMPQIPFKEIDLLIVDEMGKNIFGTGMDTNITGRKPGADMNVLWLFVRDLTEETHGNAQGIGLADFTTKRVVDKIDFNQTYDNALTAYRTDSPKIPVYLSTDKDVFEKVFEVYDVEDPTTFRIIWIKNTLELRKMLVSESYFENVEERNDLEFISQAESIEFDKDGFLINSKRYW